MGEEIEREKTPEKGGKGKKCVSKSQCESQFKSNWFSHLHFTMHSTHIQNSLNAMC